MRKSQQRKPVATTAELQNCKVFPLDKNGKPCYNRNSQVTAPRSRPALIVGHNLQDGSAGRLTSSLKNRLRHYSP